MANTLFSREKHEIEQISKLPDDARYSFDQQECSSGIIKTTTRQKVVSIEYTKFRAREKVREFPKKTSLSVIVPKGANYAFDVISAVGIGSLIEGKKLSVIKRELETRITNFTIPYSSLYDQQRKFLFYFGQLHRDATRLMKDYLHSFGKISWMIDGSLEPGSDVFFGVKECLKNIMLDCFKIPTENEKDIRECLLDVGARFGHPDEIIHDLSQVIAKACNSLNWNIVQRICHFHFTKDVGSDLYELPNENLSKQLKKLKLKLHLKTQRKAQARWLRETVNDKNDLMLEKLFKGENIPQIDNSIMAREQFLSLNHWILDYANDGNRQGFPFDPYLLYFHRRCAKVEEAIHQILKLYSSETTIPKCLVYLSEKLASYLSHPEVIAASRLYESAFTIFQDIRSCLRLLNDDICSSPIYESYDISPSEEKTILNNISDLKNNLNQQKQKTDDDSEIKLYNIAIKHIEKYEPYLTHQSDSEFNNEKIVRTTNKLEQHWGSAKRIKRQITGKKKLTREFNSLPKEYMLVQNLKNPDYVDLVIGKIETLPEKLADAAQRAGPFSHWQKKQDVKNICRINQHLLRKDDFIENLVNVSTKPFDADTKGASP